MRCGKKDLKVVAQDGESSSDAILVEQNCNYIAHDQKPWMYINLERLRFGDERNNEFSLNSIYYIIGLFKAYFEHSSYKHLPLREGLKQILPIDASTYGWTVELEKEPFARTMIEVGLTEVRKQVPHAVLYGLKDPVLYQYAVKNGLKEIVELLLNSRFAANFKDEERSHRAEEEKWVEAVHMLLVKGAVVKEIPELLHLAVELGFLDVCKLLIENGSDVNALNRCGDTPLHRSFYGERKEENRLREDEIVKLLLCNGADVNIKDRDGATAVHRAASLSQKETVLIFLNFGISVDLRAKDGSTPLHKASSPEMVEFLLKNNANVDARNNNGETPLHLACWSSKKEVVEILLKNKASANARQADGQTPLHYVAGSNIISTGLDMAMKCSASSLVDGGCDVNMENCDGQTALDTAFSMYKKAPLFRVEFALRLRTLIRLAIKLKAAGWYVSEKNLHWINYFRNSNSHPDRIVRGGNFPSDDDALPDFQQRCEEELNQLKSEKIDVSCTLYDLIASGNDPVYARDQPRMLILRSFNFEKFPVYKGLILGNLRRSEQRLQLLNSGQKALAILQKTSIKLSGNKYPALPVEILERIVSYLQDCDVNNLISCGEVLKSQLKLQV